MIQIPITNIPNQSLSIQLDSNLYDISIHATQDNVDGSTGIMGIDISINNNIILTGQRCVPNFVIIPYLYLFEGDGNFLFYTMNDNYPDWRQFGITQYLIYVSDLELQEIKNGTFTISS